MTQTASNGEPEGQARPLLHLCDGHARTFCLARHADARGALYPIELAQFALQPARAFLVGEVPAGAVRGGHAHRSARQLLVRIAGSLRVDLRWRDQRHALLLDAAQDALLLDAGVWARQTYLDTDARLLVFCDEDYATASYLADPV